MQLDVGGTGLGKCVDVGAQEGEDQKPSAFLASMSLATESRVCSRDPFSSPSVKIITTGFSSWFIVVRVRGIISSKRCFCIPRITFDETLNYFHENHIKRIQENAFLNF